MCVFAQAALPELKEPAPLTASARSDTTSHCVGTWFTVERLSGVDSRWEITEPQLKGRRKKESMFIFERGEATEITKMTELFFIGGGLVGGATGFISTNRTLWASTRLFAGAKPCYIPHLFLRNMATNCDTKNKLHELKLLEATLSFYQPRQTHTGRCRDRDHKPVTLQWRLTSFLKAKSRDISEFAQKIK